MTTRRMTIVLGLLAFVVPAVATGQGLGDAAARERAKRQAAKKAAETKVLTNEDLEKGRPPGAARTGGEATTAPAEGGGGAESGESPPLQDRLADERPYLDAIQAAQSRLSQLEARIQELRAKLNPMSGSFIYGASGSNSANEEAEVRQQLNQAEGELNAARQALVAANQALQDFRRGRSSAPPE